MENNWYETIINLIKVPFLLVIYMILVVLSFILPTKSLYKLFKIVNIEEHLSTILSKSSYLKIFAFIITLIIFTINFVS
jgi:hypothetical protein